MARPKKTPEQKAAEAQSASESAADDSEPAEQAEPEAPAQDSQPAELSLQDAIFHLTDDVRFRPHWESSLRKFADNQGVGATASADKWRECFKKYGIRLK